MPLIRQDKKRKGAVLVPERTVGIGFCPFCGPGHACRGGHRTAVTFFRDENVKFSWESDSVSPKVPHSVQLLRRAAGAGPDPDLLWSRMVAAERSQACPGPRSTAPAPVTVGRGAGPVSGWPLAGRWCPTPALVRDTACRVAPEAGKCPVPHGVGSRWGGGYRSGSRMGTNHANAGQFMRSDCRRCDHCPPGASRSDLAVSARGARVQWLGVQWQGLRGDGRAARTWLAPARAQVSALVP